jgi:hypothetical protein
MVAAEHGTDPATPLTMDTQRASDPAADWLDQLLADDGRLHRDAYIADDGFTAATMARLPAPSTAPTWRKPFVVSLWGIAAVALALAMPSLYMDVMREAYRLLAAHPVSLSGMAGAAFAIGALFCAATAYTLRQP